MPSVAAKLKVSREVVPYVFEAGDASRCPNTLDQIMRDPQRMRMMGARHMRQLCLRAFDEIRELRMALVRAGGAR